MAAMMAIMGIPPEKQKGENREIFSFWLMAII